MRRSMRPRQALLLCLQSWLGVFVWLAVSVLPVLRCTFHAQREEAQAHRGGGGAKGNSERLCGVRREVFVAGAPWLAHRRSPPGEDFSPVPAVCSLLGLGLFFGDCFGLFLGIFVWFSVDPFTKLASVTGMATTEAGEFLCFSAYWSSAIDPSPNL